MYKKSVAKTFVFTALMFCFLFVCVAGQTFATEVTETGSCGENLTYTLYDDGHLVISGTGKMTDWEDNSSPWYGKNIIKVTIGSGVTSIGDNAFCDCRTLTAVTIPDGVTGIGAWAFYSCRGLTDITIPNGVTDIGAYAFGHCSNLAGITIPSSVNVIDSGAFSNCTALTNITIPDSVTKIGFNTFNGCSSLTDIKLPKGLTKIEAYMFADCGCLTEIAIPENVTSIDYKAFYHCAALTEITIPCRVTHIGDEAFHLCENLQQIRVDVANKTYASQDGVLFNRADDTLLAYPSGRSGSYKIPYGVTNITAGAFYGCNGLTGITIPYGVTEIKAHTFYGCGSLTDITLPNTVTKIGYCAFQYCPQVANVYFLGTKEQWANVYLDERNEHLMTKVKLLFEDLDPSASDAGACGENLIYILYDDGELVISGTGDMTDWKRASGTPWYGKNITKVTVEPGVTSIGDNTFDGCGSLTGITIPDSVTRIGESAFHGCTGLTDVTLPNGVNSIGAWAFCDCTGLTDVTLPDSLLYIEKNPFAGCTNLQQIQVGEANKAYASQDSILFNKMCDTLIAYPAGRSGAYVITDNITSIGYGAFYGCGGLTGITIPESVRSIASDTFNDCCGLQEIHISDITAWCSIDFGNWYSTPLYYTGNLYVNGELLAGDFVIPDDVTDIGDYAFFGCRNLTGVTIPFGVSSIGAWAFSDCVNLSTVTIPDSVTSIGMNAFFGCSSLTHIKIPNNVTEIGSGAFENCSSLTRITIPDGVTDIENMTFSGCSSLTDIVIPNSVTNIEIWAFEDCCSLTDIIIPNSVANIGLLVFDGCTALTNIYYVGTLEQWEKVTNNLSRSELKKVKFLPPPSFPVSLTAEIEPYDTGCRVTVNVLGEAEGMSIYAAAYDASGKLLGVKSVAVTGGAVVFDELASCKVFAFDKNLRPLAVSARTKI